MFGMVDAADLVVVGVLVNGTEVTTAEEADG